MENNLSRLTQFKLTYAFNGGVHTYLCGAWNAEWAYDLACRALGFTPKVVHMEAEYLAGIWTRL